MSTTTKPFSTELETGREVGELQPAQDLVDYIKQYAAQKPEVAAIWCFGVGFILGWKLKPW